MRALPCLVLLGVVAAGTSVAAEERPQRSRLCPENLPEGARLPPQPGCTGESERPKPRRTGVYDLGDGTTVQISGRASAVFGGRR
jgi:hypothetical protein